MLFNENSITETGTITDSNSAILSNGNSYITNISIISKKGTPEASVLCGTQQIAYKNIYDINMDLSYKCSSNLVIQGTGAISNENFYSVTYIPITPTSTFQITTLGGFSYGDVTISTILLMIFCICFFATLKEWIFNIFQK